MFGVINESWEWNETWVFSTFICQCFYKVFRPLKRHVGLLYDLQFDFVCGGNTNNWQFHFICAFPSKFYFVWLPLLNDLVYFFWNDDFIHWNMLYINRELSKLSCYDIKYTFIAWTFPFVCYSLPYSIVLDCQK